MTDVPPASPVAAVAAARFTNLSAYTYGTTRLGDGSLTFDARVAIARRAMDAGVWFHTSHQYGDALQVLRAAFDQDRSHVPPAIFKIGWDSIEQIREQIHLNAEPLGIDRLEIGQLCLGSNLAQEFRTGGPCYEGFQRLREEGLVGRFVLEVWPWNSLVALEAFKAGHPDGIVEGCIFYFNPLQRFVSNDLWDLLRERDIPILAMRTVSGGPVHRLRDNPNAPEYLRARAAQVAPLYERSGCASWTEFCVRYIYGVPQVRTTVGATSRAENLQEFLEATRPPVRSAPLPDDIPQELETLQRRWADEHDAHAAPWSM